MGLPQRRFQSLDPRREIAPLLQRLDAPDQRHPFLQIHT
jgi:hypothetical protein